jgi:hypothetical protein
MQFFCYFRRRATIGYTDKKENEIFLIYRKIQKGVAAKSYMMKDFLIYEEKRKCLIIYEEDLLNYDFTTDPVLISYEENLTFFFISVIYSSSQVGTH